MARGSPYCFSTLSAGRQKVTSRRGRDPSQPRPSPGAGGPSGNRSRSRVRAWFIAVIWNRTRSRRPRQAADVTLAPPDKRSASAGCRTEAPGSRRLAAAWLRVSRRSVTRGEQRGLVGIHGDAMTSRRQLPAAPRFGWPLVKGRSARIKRRASSQAAHAATSSGRVGVRLPETLDEPALAAAVEDLTPWLVRPVMRTGRGRADELAAVGDQKNVATSTGKDITSRTRSWRRARGCHAAAPSAGRAGGGPLADPKLGTLKYCSCQHAATAAATGSAAVVIVLGPPHMPG